MWWGNYQPHLSKDNSWTIFEESNSSPTRARIYSHGTYYLADRLRDTQKGVGFCRSRICRWLIGGAGICRAEARFDRRTRHWTGSRGTRDRVVDRKAM